MFPSYVLEGLYVKGSLKNTESGFKFKLKNSIDSGTLSGMGPLTVDESSYGTDKINLTVNNHTVQGSQVSNASPLPVYTLSEVEIAVQGEPLAPGSHRLGLLFHTQEAGRMQFSVIDNLRE